MTDNLTAVLQVRVRQEEKEALKAEAEEANVNLSSVLRARIMRDPALLEPPARVPAPQAEEEDPRPEARQKEKAAETWIVRRTNELALRKPKRRALAQANKEWDERNG